MKKYICRLLVLPCLVVSLLAVVIVTGAIENGGALSLCWIAFAAIGATWVIIRTAAKG